VNPKRYPVRLARLAVAALIAAVAAGCGGAAAVATPTGIPAPIESPAPPSPSPAPSTDTPAVPAVPQAGLAFSTADGLWLIDRQGQPALVVDSSNARVSPDGRLVAYLKADANDVDDVWLLDRSSGETRDLTNTPDRYETTPMWWPGRSDVVVFGSDTATGMENHDYPTIVNLDGSDYRIIDDTHGGPRALSPDGSAIAYGGYDALGAIFRWDSGIQSFDPRDYGIQADKLFQPAWSPDGSQLAWLVAGDLQGQGSTQLGLAVFDLQARSALLIHAYQPVGGGTFPQDVGWSPDGSWIAFLTFGEPPATGRAANLWVVHPDGTGEVHVAEGLNPVWSLDGSRLAYLRTGPDGSQEIWMAEAGSWQAEQLSLPPEAKATLFLMGWTLP
jgi:Tol biopolymer transport system component